MGDRVVRGVVVAHGTREGDLMGQPVALGAAINGLARHGSAQDFASYQSDGMLLEAAFISFFLAPRGVRPGLGAHDPPSRFARWLADQSRPARAPSGGEASRGRAEFLNGTCSTCHAIRGTSASSNVGPDLTHLASRTTLAALSLPNDRSSLRGWLRDPQHVKPGNQMPALDLSSSQLDALVAYLEGLR